MICRFQLRIGMGGAREQTQLIWFVYPCERFSVIIQVYGSGFRYDIIADIFKAIFSLADCNTYRG